MPARSAPTRHGNCEKTGTTNHANFTDSWHETSYLFAMLPLTATIGRDKRLSQNWPGGAITRFFDERPRPSQKRIATLRRHFREALNPCSASLLRQFPWLAVLVVKQPVGRFTVEKSFVLRVPLESLTDRERDIGDEAQRRGAMTDFHIGVGFFA